jgi:hypothetical protein
VVVTDDPAAGGSDDEPIGSRSPMRSTMAHPLIVDTGVQPFRMVEPLLAVR